MYKQFIERKGHWKKIATQMMASLAFMSSMLEAKFSVDFFYYSSSAISRGLVSLDIVYNGTIWGLAAY